jgi:hypothetical protein
MNSALALLLAADPVGLTDCLAGPLVHAQPAARTGIRTKNYKWVTLWLASRREIGASYISIVVHKRWRRVSLPTPRKDDLLSRSPTLFNAS